MASTVRIDSMPSTLTISNRADLGYLKEELSRMNDIARHAQWLLPAIISPANLIKKGFLPASGQQKGISRSDIERQRRDDGHMSAFDTQKSRGQDLTSSSFSPTPGQKRRNANKKGILLVNNKHTNKQYKHTKIRTSIMKKKFLL
ncbi:hypothetical protein CAPTEDRAFT_211887 [Capitella teleta]|uniref:Uncharacterized protein n=1 Tax=Capitella teleta TaxID=283909 RepID=R7U8E3_CAPTE|nr:hypothetical protein CAPTEDRAFT_211887 [Capitella teleta]|eukprot:ELT99360.1 hypothetical protein CAPTEDRAFT_211887 [Capitella teleta]